MPYLLLWVGTLAGVLLISAEAFTVWLLTVFGTICIYFGLRNSVVLSTWLLVTAIGMVLGGISGLPLQHSQVLIGDVCIGVVVKQYDHNASVQVDSCVGSGRNRALIYSQCERALCPTNYSYVKIQVTSREKFGRFNGKAKITAEPAEYTETGKYRNVYYKLLRLGFAYRESYFLWLRRDLPEEHAALVTSMLFGETHIPKELIETMKKLGLLHVVAISGINIRYLQLLVSQITNKWRRKYRSAADFLVLFLLFIVVGEAVSLFRAIIMVLLLHIIKTTGMLPVKWHFSVGLAALLLVNPSYLFDAGYWLVSGACVGIYIVAAWIEKWRLRLVLQEILVNIGIWGCVAPVQWVIFKEITPWGIAVGMLISPVIEVLTIIGYFCTLGRFVFGFEMVLRVVLGVLSSIILFIINMFHGAAVFP